MYDFLTLQEWPLLSRFTVPAHFGVCLSQISRTVAVTSDVLLQCSVSDLVFSTDLATVRRALIMSGLD